MAASMSRPSRKSPNSTTRPFVNSLESPRAPWPAMRSTPETQETRPRRPGGDPRGSAPPEVSPYRHRTPNEIGARRRLSRDCKAMRGLLRSSVYCRFTRKSERRLSNLNKLFNNVVNSAVSHFDSSFSINPTIHGTLLMVAKVVARGGKNQREGRGRAYAAPSGRAHRGWCGSFGEASRHWRDTPELRPGGKETNRGQCSTLLRHHHDPHRLREEHQEIPGTAKTETTEGTEKATEKIRLLRWVYWKES